jgi:hypothetical protein
MQRRKKKKKRKKAVELKNKNDGKLSNPRPPPFCSQGFTKEFTTLTALITHHSVMPELLPCPLSLSRYNPSFVKADSSKDFADIDSDPDYNTLADFRKMMADLNV